MGCYDVGVLSSLAVTTRAACLISLPGNFITISIINMALENADMFKKHLLGTTPTEEDKDIKGCRLPTMKQTLLCYLAHYDHGNVTKRDAPNLTVEKVLDFYHRARIPTLQKHKMAEEVLKLHKRYRDILAIRPMYRSKGKAAQNISGFIDDMSKTMKFWPRNVLDTMENEEDKQFIISMMEDRKFTMVGVDKITARKERKNIQSKDGEMSRSSRDQSELTSQFETVEMIESETSTGSEAEDNDFIAPSTSTRKHRRIIKTGVDCHIPPDILKKPRVVQALVRNAVSSTTISAVMHEITLILKTLASAMLQPKNTVL